jgi:hypothetical protein
MSDATWRNVDDLSVSGWSVLEVSHRSRGFCGALVALGFDNTRPDETRGQTERRIAARFEVPRGDLVLEVCNR